MHRCCAHLASLHNRYTGLAPFWRTNTWLHKCFLTVVKLSATHHSAHHGGNAKVLTASCAASQRVNTCVGAGFETMAGTHTSMLANANCVANQDRAALELVQQTAARGEAHVQGKPLTSQYLIDQSRPFKPHSRHSMPACRHLLCIRLLQQWKA